MIKWQARRVLLSVNTGKLNTLTFLRLHLINAKSGCMTPLTNVGLSSRFSSPFFFGKTFYDMAKWKLWLWSMLPEKGNLQKRWRNYHASIALISLTKFLLLPLLPLNLLVLWNPDMGRTGHIFSDSRMPDTSRLSRWWGRERRERELAHVKLDPVRPKSSQLAPTGNSG